VPDADRLHKDLRKAFSDGDTVMALRILGQARGLLSDVHGRKLRSVLESTMISRTVGKLRRCEKMAAEVRARAGELNAAWKASIKRGTIDRPVAVRRPDFSFRAPCASRFPCLKTIAGQIIYYLTLGVLGACRQAPYKLKKLYGGGFVYTAPHSEHTKSW
jgi:hypothetical protein